MKEFYSVEEAAKVLDTTRQWLNKLAQDGRVKVVRISKRFHAIKAEEVERLKREWVKEKPRGRKKKAK